MVQLPDMKANQTVRIKVVDVETTTADGDPDWVHSANRVVLYGVYDPDVLTTTPSVCTPFKDTAKRLLCTASHVVQFDDVKLFVGHNLMFDIGYLLKEEVITQEHLATNVKIWDTMIAEYILSAQQTKFASMEDICISRKIPFLKDPVVQAIFKEGKGADAVPLGTLTQYLLNDLATTYKIFIAQYEEAHKLGMLPLIAAMMDFRLATIDMRWNGIKIDTHALSATKVACLAAAATARASIDKTHNLLKHTSTHYPSPMLTDAIDPAKPAQLLKLLFGGSLWTREAKVVGKYKNGKDRTKLEDVEIPYKGILEMIGVDTTKLEKSCDENTLENIIHTLFPYSIPTGTGLAFTNHCLKLLLQKVLELRKAQKTLSTYVEPTELDAAKFGNRLHPIINTTTTNTGRTSCSKPNLQNVPKNSLGDYRRCLVPSIGGHYKLVEFDYKQLEVVALAVLCQDKQLIQDLMDGTDMHKELFLQVHGRIPTDEERTDFKRAVFCLIYGGGTMAIAEQGKISNVKAMLLRNKFVNRYPYVVALRRAVKTKVDQTSHVVAEQKFGIPHRKGYWTSPTNRVYAFEQRLYENRNGWKHSKAVMTKECNWSDQEIANYPIQGLATADMVPLMVGALYRYVYSEQMDKASHGMRPRLIMTIHDAVLMEVYAESASSLAVINLVRTFLERLPVCMKEVFGMDCAGLLFKVGVSVGDNWEDMEKLKETV